MLESLAPAKPAKEEKKAEDAAAEPIDFAYFTKMVLKAAKVVSAEKVEKSDKLLKLQIDLGGETRQVVSGIAKSYSAEDMVGKTVCVVANLKPAKLMGIMSEGMILAATQGDKHIVLELPDSVEAGTIIK